MDSLRLNVDRSDNANCQDYYDKNLHLFLVLVDLKHASKYYITNILIYAKLNYHLKNLRELMQFFGILIIPTVGVKRFHKRHTFLCIKICCTR